MANITPMPAGSPQMTLTS